MRRATKVEEWENVCETDGGYSDGSGKMERIR